MSAPHAGFILAAYLITFAVVGAMIATIVLRHRGLTRALAQLRSDDAGERGGT